jgi:hypothetical protein
LFSPQSGLRVRKRFPGLSRWRCDPSIDVDARIATGSSDQPCRLRDAVCVGKDDQDGGHEMRGSAYASFQHDCLLEFAGTQRPGFGINIVESGCMSTVEKRLYLLFFYVFLCRVVSLVLLQAFVLQGKNCTEECVRPD